MRQQTPKFQTEKERKATHQNAMYPKTARLNVDAKFTTSGYGGGTVPGGRGERGGGKWGGGGGGGGRGRSGDSWDNNIRRLERLAKI